MILIISPEQAFSNFIFELKKQIKAELLKELRSEIHHVPNRTLNIQEACEYLGMKEYTLRQLCREKKIPHLKYGAEGSKKPRYLFNTASLDKWIREQEEMNYQPASGRG